MASPRGPARPHDGSLSDLPSRPSPAVWDEVASDSSNCLGKNCGTYATCFYYRARRRIQHAQLLVVNHALFFSDLALRAEGASILPDYDAVIFDEAHTLADVAADHLGFRITSRQLDYALNKLYNDRTPERASDPSQVCPTNCPGSTAVGHSATRILRRV